MAEWPFTFRHTLEHYTTATATAKAATATQTEKKVSLSFQLRKNLPVYVCNFYFLLLLRIMLAPCVYYTLVYFDILCQRHYWALVRPIFIFTLIPPFAIIPCPTDRIDFP